MSWETWSFAFDVTVPNLLMMLLGILLRHWRLMDDRFVDGATRLVFNLALPCLLFFSIATNHPQLLGNLPLVLFGAVGTLATFLLLELAARWVVKEPRERGVFVQGGFRANTAIVGLAYAMTSYGSEGIALASLYLTVTVILFNILSDFCVRFLDILEINTRGLANHFPNVNRNRQHDTIVARLKLRPFEFEVDVIVVECLVVKMKIGTAGNCTFRGHC